RKGKRESENLESAEEIGYGNGLIESETQDGKTQDKLNSRTEGKLPGGKPERVSRVSTKEASVP
ncbi:hypothetical protein, partial [Streptomyces turgidiscabies]|uniref:hypothetical protein n=1 Tax=Streptomyces turgidiscabies TaxID=85558 RepID=UPI0019D6B531